MLIGVINVKSDYVNGDIMSHILAALMPANRLAIVTSIYTGLRIGDVLALKSSDLLKDRFTIKEQKTGKSRRIRLPNKLKSDLLAQAGRYYVFEHRTDPKKHRTRQAVNKDIKRACELFRVSKLNVSPHTARKIYAVEEYHKSGSLKRVQQLLNHSNESVTMIYALADELVKRK